jgi:hypothetical protein
MTSILLAGTGPRAALPAALADRAAATPEEPWLFYRDADDWRWRSWGQVADQAARGAAALRPPAGTARVAVDDRLHPDAVAAALAVQAAGGAAVPGGEGAALALPPVRSRLARWTPDLDALRHAAADAVAFAGPRDQEGRTHRDLIGAAIAWSDALPAPRGRPIVLASPGVGRLHRQVLLAWNLFTGAAWVLEDDPIGFLPAVLRNRPTFVLAPGADLALLATALRERRHRRWHRLRAVGLTDEASAELYLGDEWDALGVPVVRLGRRP